MNCGEKSVNEINLINIFEDAIIEVGKEYGSFDFGKEYMRIALASVIGEHPDLRRILMKLIILLSLIMKSVKIKKFD